MTSMYCPTIAPSPTSRFWRRQQSASSHGNYNTSSMKTAYMESTRVHIDHVIVLRRRSSASTMMWHSRSTNVGAYFWCYWTFLLTHLTKLYCCDVCTVMACVATHMLGWRPTCRAEPLWCVSRRTSQKAVSSGLEFRKGRSSDQYSSTSTLRH